MNLFRSAMTIACCAMVSAAAHSQETQSDHEFSHLSVFYNGFVTPAENTKSNVFFSLENEPDLTPLAGVGEKYNAELASEPQQFFEVYSGPAILIEDEIDCIILMIENGTGGFTAVTVDRRPPSWVNLDECVMVTGVYQRDCLSPCIIGADCLTGVTYPSQSCPDGYLE